MAKTEDTALSALLSALGKGVMQLPVEMEKQKEVQRQNALTNYQMMQQQDQQRQQQERSTLQNDLTKLQMAELNEKIRRAAMEPYMTEEQRMAMKQANELEQLKQQAMYSRQQAESVANINQQGKINELLKAVELGVTTGGNNPTLPKPAPSLTPQQQIDAAKDQFLLGHGFASGQSGENKLQSLATTDRATYNDWKPWNNADTSSEGSNVGLLKQLGQIAAPPIMGGQPQSTIDQNDDAWGMKNIKDYASLDATKRAKAIAGARAKGYLK